MKAFLKVIAGLLVVAMIVGAVFGSFRLARSCEDAGIDDPVQCVRAGCDFGIRAADVVVLYATMRLGLEVAYEMSQHRPTLGEALILTWLESRKADDQAATPTPVPAPVSSPGGSYMGE